MPTRRATPARSARATLAQRPRFAASLLLPRAFAAQFGLRDAALLKLLAEADPSRDAAGTSGCARLLAALPQTLLAPATLQRWDAAIGGHEQAIGGARAAHALAAGEAPADFRLTHFQWLACAVVEWHLEALAGDAAGHVARLDALRERELPHLPPYRELDARKLACFMATGAGKTLVLHMNLRQFRAHRLFEPQQVLLLTSSEALSQQHAAELAASGLGAVRITEITKFYVDGAGARRPKKGVSEPTSRCEGPNLLLVDEGHKGGGGSGERAWREIREALAAGATAAQAGFTFEYSATFAQIADRDEALYDDYARAVAVDFGYARFWREGYGKQPRQINARAEAGAEFALAAGLVAFYQQRLAYAEQPALAREYLVAAPLLACVGKDVTAGGDSSDVALLLRFLARACADTGWLAGRVAEVLAGAEPVRSGIGLPPLDLRWLREAMAARGWDAAAAAADLARRVFGGAGAVSLHLVGANEIGLKSRGAADDAYFGVVRVGEAKKLADTLAAAGIASLGEPDRMHVSLFARIDADARLAVLVGAKMFIEGWSSWRVSALGLMNVGRSPGAEIVQLFGRGVRLRGRGFSLKRDEDAPAPVQVLQSLQVFGVKADYLQEFLDALAREGVQPQVLHVPVTPEVDLGALGLSTLQTGGGRFDACVAFDAAAVAPQTVVIDPAVRASVGLAGAQAVGAPLELVPSMRGFIDGEAAYQHALMVKRRLGLHGLVFAPAALVRWLAACSVQAPVGWFTHPPLGTARRVTAALSALDAGLARAWRQAERRWRMAQLAEQPLTEANAGLPRAPDPAGGWAWRLELDVAEGVAGAVLRAVDEVIAQGLAPPALRHDIEAVLAQHSGKLLDVLPRIQAILDDPARLAQDELTLPLPRLHGLPHLFSPLLLEKGLAGSAANAVPPQGEQFTLFDSAAWTDNTAVAIRPPALNEGEGAFVWNLRAWWKRHHAQPGWKDIELYLLRNPAAGGLRLWRDSGFAPDFMLWLKRGVAQVLGLVDPKGLAREWPTDKLALLAELEAQTRLSVPVRGALVSVTVPPGIALPPGQGGDPDALWRARVLLQSDPAHIDRLMNHLLSALPAGSPP